MSRKREGHGRGHGHWDSQRKAGVGVKQRRSPGRRDARGTAEACSIGREHSSFGLKACSSEVHLFDQEGLTDQAVVRGMEYSRLRVSCHLSLMFTHVVSFGSGLRLPVIFNLHNTFVLYK